MMQHKTCVTCHRGGGTEYATFSNVCAEADVILCTVVHCTYFLFVTKLKNMHGPSGPLTPVGMK